MEKDVLAATQLVIVAEPQTSQPAFSEIPSQDHKNGESEDRLYDSRILVNDLKPLS
jgi:hypothetical protein